jgi:hypothetical protein
MKNNLATKLALAALLLPSCMGLFAQSTSGTGDPGYDFYKVRDAYARQLKEKETTEIRQDDGEWHEDMDRLRFERWNWYWKDRLEVSYGNEEIKGRPADVSLYMRSFYYAMNGTTPPATSTGAVGRGASGGQSLLALSSPICTSGGGNWTCLGPGTATTTHPASIMGLVSAIHVDPAVANAQHMYIGTRGGGLFETTNGGSSWVNLTDASRMPAISVTSIAVAQSNPSVMYISSSFDNPGNIFDFAHRGGYGFGVLKTTNGGISWTEVLTLNNYLTGNWVDQCIREIKIHPQDDNTIYAVGQFKVFRSTDAGATWTVVLDIPPVPGGNECAWPTAHVEILPGATGVNDSYVMVNTFATGWSMNGNYGCVPARTYISSTGGSLGSFTEITASILGTDYTEEISIALQPGNNNEFFLFYIDLNSSAALRLKKYNKTTGTVTSLGSGPNGFGAGPSLQEFIFSKNDPNIYFIGGWILARFDMSQPNAGMSGGGAAFSVYSPTSGCNTPEPHFTHADIRSVAVTTSGTNDIFLLGDDGGIQKLVFNPTTQTTLPIWTNINGPGFNTSAFFWLAASENNADVLVAGTQDNGQFEYLGGTWALRSLGDGYRGAINTKTTPNKYYGNVNGSALQGPVGSCYSGGSYPGLWMYRGNIPLVSNPRNEDTLYTVGMTASGHCLYMSPDFGVTWSSVPFFPPTSRAIQSIRISPSNPNVIYVAKAGPGWISNLSDFLFRVEYNPNTATWSCQDLQGVPSANPLWIMQWASVTDIAIDALNPNHLFVSINGYSPVSNTSLAGKDRVFESTDGGYNWTNITDNMLAFPVMALAYQGGSDDFLYAGTDVGVFRYNKSNPVGSKWECFMNGLPVAAITHLEINHCKGKIRAATFGRSAWESDLPPINVANQLVVNATTNWNTDRRLTSDVFVTGNSTLTVSKTVYMQAGKKIIIDRGSTLIVTGTGKITNCCGDMWLGVEVWGTPTVSQATAGAQGKVTLQAGSVIENCQEGIVTAKNIGGTPDLTYTGGIIQALGANFYNNRRDVVFYPYQWSIANNFSYLRNCTFETKAQLGNSLTPDAHVRLDGVKNVSLVGNRYKNTTSTSVYAPTFRGTGIYATNSQCMIDDYLPTSVNVFDGLTRGVNANFTVGTVKSFHVYNTDFNNVERGVEINYSYSSTVSANTFTNVPLATTTNFVDATWAVRVNNATVFYVLNNNITGASPSYQNNYGVIADNCGSNAGTVSGNTIKDVYTGIQAQGANGSGTNGVQFKCNTFQQSIRFQIAVCPATAGTLADQGSGCTLGNTRQNNFYVNAIPFCNQVSVGTGTSFTYYASGTIPTNNCGSVTVVSCAVSGECTSPPPPRLAADTTGPAMPEVIGALTTLNTKDTRVTLAGTYISQGRLPEAAALISSFRFEKGMEDVVGYYDIMIAMTMAHRTIYDLSARELNTLEVIALGKSPVALSAQVILSAVRGNTYERITEHFESDRLEAAPGAVKASSLSDNMPNPFDNNTVIRCTVEPTAKNAFLEITDVSGKVVKTIPLVAGENTVTVEAADLGSGVYFYSLLTDGKRVETKRMVIAGK